MTMDATPADPALARAAAAPPVKAARVAIVDDEEALRRLWARQLQKAGHEVAMFDNTADARAALESTPYDLLMCDLHMPGESGMTLLRDLDGRFPDMAKLMISGVGDADVAGEALKLGAYGYLVKPLTPRQLLVSVSNALRQLEMERARRDDLDRLGESVAQRDEALENERTLRMQREGAAAANARRAQEKSDVAASLRRRTKWLERVATLQRDIPPRAPVAQVAAALARTARELLEADAAEVWLLDPDGAAGTALLAGADGATAADAGTHQPLDAGPAAAAIAREAAAPCGADEVGARLSSAGLPAALAVPLREEGTVIGALVVASKTAGHAYADDEQEMVATLAAHAALVIGAAAVRERLGGAFRDTVTRLPGRPEFVALAQQRIDAGDSALAPPAIVLIGIDRFPQIPPAGAVEDSLRAVADALRGQLSNGEAIGYLGGGRFAAMLDEAVARADPLRVAEVVHEAVADALAAQHSSLHLTASAGVAFGDGVEDVLRQAGAALYAARTAGGGHCESFRPGAGASLRGDVALREDLARAVEFEAVTARYQPVVSLAHRAVAALHVVPRWSGRSREPVPPALFMPLAEEVGMVDAIERKLLADACAQAVEWGAQFRAGQPLPISMPLSAATLLRPELPGDVAAILKRSGLHASKLIVEVDESLLVTRLSELRDPLAALAELGVRIAVGDFGARSFELHYLEEVPIARVKPDRTLVEGLGHDAEEDAPMRVVVALAKAYGIEVVAQGVERAPQMVKLRGIGCEFAQGPHFAAPLDPLRISAMLQRARRGGGGATAGPEGSELRFSR